MDRKNIRGPSSKDLPNEGQLRINKINEELSNEKRASRISNDGGRWKVGSTTIVSCGLTKQSILGRRPIGSPILGRSSVVPILGRTPEVPILGRPPQIPILGRSSLIPVSDNNEWDSTKSFSEYSDTYEGSSIGSSFQERSEIETPTDTISEGGSSNGSTFESSLLENGSNESGKLERIPITPCNIAGRRILRPRRSAKTPYARSSTTVELRKAMRPPGTPILGRKQPKKNLKEEQSDPNV